MSFADVCEIFCTDVAPYAPSQDLQNFLEAGSPPIYVEFGTLVAEDPEQPLAMILSAVRDAGVRAIISHEWNTPKLIAGADIFYTMDCSREWVLAHVPVVIHRGEAGMTGCGLRHGCSTITITRTGE
jgi:sterol 3beta-glucosyltransferase